MGWEVIDGYDELLLVNDSAYLLTPLDEVFERMDARPCDWWGLQATKRDYEAARGDVEPLPLVEAKARYRGQRTWQQIMHLHISSYFIALRRPAHSHPDVRELLSDVTKAPSKGQVILRYEVGLSRVLMDQGFDFDTFIDDLYPYHPLYTSDYFSLLQRHFPLLKRNLLSHNPRKAPDLSRWKERVLELAPLAPVDVLERNLLRVAPDDAPAEQLCGRDRRRRLGGGPAPAQRASDGAPGRANAHLRPLVGLSGLCLRPHVCRQRARRLRAGPRRPVDQEDRAHQVPPGRRHR